MTNDPTDPTDPIGDLERGRMAAEIEDRARRIAERYTFNQSPGWMVKLDRPPPIEVCLPDGLCWQEFDNPPASEVANGHCYGKERYIYGCNGVPWLTHSPYEDCEWPVTLARGTEYFVVWIYKDAAL